MRKKTGLIASLLLILALAAPLVGSAPMAASSPSITTVSVTDLTPGTAAQGTLKIPILEFTVSSSKTPNDKLKKLAMTYTGSAIEDIAAIYLYRESSGSGGTFNPATDVIMASQTSPTSSPVTLDPPDFTMTTGVSYQFYIVVDLQIAVPDYRDCVSTQIDAKIDVDDIDFDSGKWPPSGQAATWNPSGETWIQNSQPWSGFTPTDDSWVQENDAAKTHGSDNTLHIRWMKAGEERRAYLEFDLSCLPPCSTINSAILHVYRANQNGVPSAYNTSDGWTEGTITWNNAPALGDWVADGTGSASPAAQWLTWNVTSYAETEFAGDQTLSMVLKFKTGPVNDSTYHADCVSNEATSNRPYLEISYSTTQYTLTTNANPPGGGTVTPGGTYDCGTNVSINATPTSSWSFAGWTTDGDIGEIADPAEEHTFVYIDRDKTVTASFAPCVYNLTVESDGCCPIEVSYDSFHATVDADSSDSFGIPCDTDVTLTAVDDIGCVFDQWTGDVPGGTNSSNPITITVSGNKTVTGSCYSLGTYNLTVESDGCCPITVEWDTNSEQVDAGGSKTFKDIPYGTNVTLTANNSTCCGFTQWTVDNSPAGASNIIEVNMGANHTAVAVCNATCGSIGDTVFYDDNNSGTQDPGEGGIQGVTAKLYIDDGDAVFEPMDEGGDDELRDTRTTDANGKYEFDNLEVGYCYWVLVDESTLPAGLAVTTGSNPTRVCVAEAEFYDEADFGYFAPAQPVGGTAYPINKVAVLAPWIALAAAFAVGICTLERRRRAQS
jgi:hypothetical protein